MFRKTQLFSENQKVCIFFTLLPALICGRPAPTGGRSDARLRLPSGGGGHRLWAPWTAQEPALDSVKGRVTPGTRLFAEGAGVGSCAGCSFAGRADDRRAKSINGQELGLSAMCSVKRNFFQKIKKCAFSLHFCRRLFAVRSCLGCRRSDARLRPPSGSDGRRLDAPGRRREDRPNARRFRNAGYPPYDCEILRPKTPRCPPYDRLVCIFFTLLRTVEDCS